IAGVHACGEGRPGRPQLRLAGGGARRTAEDRGAAGTRAAGRAGGAEPGCAIDADDRASAGRAAADRPVLAVVGGARGARRARSRRPHPEAGPRSPLPVEILVVAARLALPFPVPRSLFPLFRSFALRRVDVAQGADEASGTLIGLVFGRLVAGPF